MKNICKLCGSETRSFSLKDITLYECINPLCGLVSDHLKHSNESVFKIYDDFYQDDGKYNMHIESYSQIAKKEKLKLGWNRRCAIKLSKIETQTAASILEVGAGVGVFGHHVLNKYPNCQYLGIDIAAPAVKLGAKLTNNRITLSTIQDLDNNLKFDYIFAFEVVEHIPDLQVFLTQLVCHLQHGGRLLLSVPNFEKHKNNGGKLSQPPPPIHVNFFNKSNIKNILQMMGFHVTSIKTRPYPWLNSPKKHWLACLLGRYHGSTLVVSAKVV